MGGRKKVLIVDDSQAYVNLILSVLDGRYELIQAQNAEAGLNEVSAAKPDLILLDVRLPGMDGIEFVRLLAKNADTRGIPVIVMTAYDYDSATESLLKNESAVRFFLSKLSPVETLCEKISEVLEKGDK
jgi:CheY-like chemotaxis protein